MIRKMMFFLFLGVAVLLNSTAFAYHSNGPHGGEECSRMMHKEKSPCPIANKFMMKTRFLLELKTDIGLTEDQVKAIKDLKLQVEKDSIRQNADMKTFMLDLHSKLVEDTVDVKETSYLIDKGFAAASTAAKLNLEAYAKLKSLLSSEQIAKMKELHARMEKKGEGKRD